MHPSSHIHRDITADITARRVAAAAMPVGRRRRNPLAAAAPRLVPAAPPPGTPRAPPAARPPRPPPARPVAAGPRPRASGARAPQGPAEVDRAGLLLRGAQR